MDLDASLLEVRGVGAKTAELLGKAGIGSIRDFIYYFPRAYEDFSLCQNVVDIRPGRVVVRAEAEKVSLRRARRLTIVEATLRDESGAMKAVWFNQSYRVKQLMSGKKYYFSGTYELNRGKYQLMNPAVELAEDIKNVAGGGLVPVYRAAGELKTQDFVRIMKGVRAELANVPETLPRSVIDASGVKAARGEALYLMHFPENAEDVERARERLGFEELFELTLASKLNKIENQKLKAPKMDFDLVKVKAFVGKLPYKLTNAQRSAAWEIIQDLGREMPMNRLLQGDVGSGKTVVAGLAAYQAHLAGYQTAFMAPTEILAGQHAETLSRLLGGFGVRVALLTGKSKNRKILCDMVADGQVDIVVGTHALFSGKIRYKNLGLVVVDEQHRFGVEQRQRLISKAVDGTMPHMLSTTATPIPRSLQLTVFGELDVSVLGELPKGRRAITTKIVNPVGMEGVFDVARSEIANGRQVYYVCPKIEDTLGAESKNVMKEYERLKKVFSKHKVGLLHGKMNVQEKDEVMAGFLGGEIDVLVATTVVEVGVDVPNATVMVIRDADRFGLAQLHQLRGRVGRGECQSYCYLVTSTDERLTRRLREVERSTDGFYLAEKDLEIRGPGEIYGRMQHGELDLRLASVTDTGLVRRASRAADAFLKSVENLLDYKELARNVQKYQRLTTLN